LTQGRVRHWPLPIRANACRACRYCWTLIGRIRGSPATAISAHKPSTPSSETLLAQAHGWAAKFLCIILIALIATLLGLLTEVFRTMSGRPAFADPPSQETQPQMRAGYGS
jgi:hypothetical protein